MFSGAMHDTHDAHDAHDPTPISLHGFSDTDLGSVEAERRTENVTFLGKYGI